MIELDIIEHYFTRPQGGARRHSENRTEVKGMEIMFWNRHALRTNSNVVRK